MAAWALGARLPPAPASRCPAATLHRVYPDLATLRAALGGPEELRLIEDQGDDALLTTASGQIADRGGGDLLLFTHALYDPDGVWSRVQAATREEPSALLGRRAVLMSDRIGTLIQVGPASALAVLPSERGVPWRACRWSAWTWVTSSACSGPATPVMCAAGRRSGATRASTNTTRLRCPWRGPPPN